MDAKYRLFLIDFESAMSMEEGWYVLQAKKPPTEDEAVKALYDNTYTGTIYYNGYDEIFEKDIRHYKGRVTFMSLRESR